MRCLVQQLQCDIVEPHTPTVNGAQATSTKDSQEPAEEDDEDDDDDDEGPEIDFDDEDDDDDEDEDGGSYIGGDDEDEASRALSFMYNIAHGYYGDPNMGLMAPPTEPPAHFPQFHHAGAEGDGDEDGSDDDEGIMSSRVHDTPLALILN